jgi:hypothetical protein
MTLSIREVLLCRVSLMLSVIYKSFMLSVIYKSFMLSVTMLSVIMLIVFMLNVAVLSVVAPRLEPTGSYIRICDIELR